MGGNERKIPGVRGVLEKKETDKRRRLVDCEGIGGAGETRFT
jgi:hypothetical protein